VFDSQHTSFYFKKINFKVKVSMAKFNNLPANKNLSGQLLLRSRGVPGSLVSIKLSYAKVNCLRISFTRGCSCCGQSKYIFDIQSPFKEDLIKSIKKFGAFSYKDKSEPQEDKLWVNIYLLSGISSDINNYHTEPQQMCYNYHIVKDFLINAENNQDTSISNKCNIRIRKIRGGTFLFNHATNSFGGNFDFLYGDDRIFGVN